jgi:uncharacterized protein (DUF58 family)
MAIEALALVDPEFLASIQHLRIVARRVPPGGRFAEQRSADLGSGLEFRDYRAYTPGDDLRAVDWNIYRRLGRVFLRLFEELEDLPVYLMPDVSRSAFVETPPRAYAGLRTALALASIALGQHDSVGLFPFAGDLEIAVRPQAGHGRLLTFANALERVWRGGGRGATDIATALRRFDALPHRRGLIVLISDFFDPRGLDEPIAALKRTRHRLLLIQLVRAGDADPTERGDLRLRDCETGTTEDVSVTPAVIERYRAAHARFQARLSDFARGRGAGLLQLDVEQPIVGQLAALFEHGRVAV